MLGRRFGRPNLDQRPIGQRVPEELDDSVAHDAIDFGYDRGNTPYICGGYSGGLPRDPAVHRQIRQPVGVTVLRATRA